MAASCGGRIALDDLDRVRPTTPTTGHGFDREEQDLFLFDRSFASKGEVLERAGPLGRDDIESSSVSTGTAAIAGHAAKLARTRI